ncbi:MAG: nicotinate (nicotinamide) nucleotide adenylyltransferase [Spirochaetes bacterium]|nr:nicotinate (nicotinamide) nucleotide adenylyltransferase [Spirochaetota bacterium]
MRIGLFPGSFDPPHIGHLIMACDFYYLLSLDIVYFIPTKKYKTDKQVYAKPEERLKMVSLMIKDFPFFEVSDFEINSGEINYTYKTLEYFMEKFTKFKKDQKNYKNIEINDCSSFFILVGYDWKDDLKNWKNIEFIKKNSKIVLYYRYNKDLFLLTKNFDNSINNNSKLCIENILVEDDYIVIGRPITISSSEIRNNIKEGKVYKQFLVEEVYKYIEEKNLYL